MAKGGLFIRVSNKNHRNTPIFDFQPMVNSKDGGNLMPCCLPFGLRSPSFDPTSRESRRTPDPALPRVRSRFTTASPLAPFAVKRRSRRREALKPSDFCNDRVNSADTGKLYDINSESSIDIIRLLSISLLYELTPWE